MGNKRVVVNYTGRKGGGAVFAYEMTKSLVENGCIVYAIISEDIENINKWKELFLEDLIIISTYSNTVNFITNSISFKLFGLPRIKNKFKNKKIDTVYVPMIQPWSGLINSVFKETQKIVTVHDPKPHSGSNLIFNYLSKKAAMDADDIVILSETFKEYSAQHYGKEKKNIHVIPHGIFDYYKGVEDLNNSVHYDKDKINFLFFGRITKYKGLGILSQAYEMLTKEFDNITLSVVGNGNFEEYREEYSRLNNVKIVNRWINDEEVGSFFKGDNIVTVLPYMDATQSGVIPIAMDYNSLVIASNTGGLSEQVKHGETGYLFETGNPKALYETMKYIVENYNEQKYILKSAEAYIKSLSWDVLGEKLIKIFE